MAFTVSHMAAALPFFRQGRWLNFEALLIGTMMPDLPYYMPYFIGRGWEDAHRSHQWLGLLSYCLPWGLLIFVLWCWWLKPAAISLVRPWVDEGRFTKHSAWKSNVQRASSFWSSQLFKSWLSFFMTVVFALMVGASTHLLWDGITHEDGFISERLAWLQSSVNVIYLGEMSRARFLQYLTSIAGLLLLCRFAWIHLLVPQASASPLSSDNSLTNNLPHTTLQSGNLSLKKVHSIVIVGIISLLPLFWMFQVALKWDGLPNIEFYSLVAMILVGLLKRVGALFTLYALIYQFLQLSHYIQLVKKSTNNAS